MSTVENEISSFSETFFLFYVWFCFNFFSFFFISKNCLHGTCCSEFWVEEFFASSIFLFFLLFYRTLKFLEINSQFFLSHLFALSFIYYYFFLLFSSSLETVFRLFFLLLLLRSSLHSNHFWHVVVLYRTSFGFLATSKEGQTGWSRELCEDALQCTCRFEIPSNNACCSLESIDNSWTGSFLLLVEVKFSYDNDEDDDNDNVYNF